MTDPISPLRAVATPGLPAGNPETGTVIVPSADTAMPAVWTYFGTDDDRATCHVIVAGEDVGFVGRGALMLGMGDQMRGLGDVSAGFQVPGTAIGFVEIELRCDEPGCPLNPIFDFFYDPEFPEPCPLHPKRVLHPPEEQ
jgi:hypothetical protein